MRRSFYMHARQRPRIVREPSLWRVLAYTRATKPARAPVHLKMSLDELIQTNMSNLRNHSYHVDLHRLR